MFIEIKVRSRCGWTLPEMAVSLAVFGIASLALVSIFLFSLRSMASLTNYAILDANNRQTMDKLTLEIREAQYVSNYSTNPPTLTIMNGDSQLVTYRFDTGSHRMTRTVDGASQVLLENCNLMDFRLYQRNPSNFSYNVYPLATGSWKDTVKVVELTWKTSRNIGGLARVNSENVQTARIVIRK